MGKKSQFKGKKQYAHYESQGRYAKNKKAKLLRHLKSNPDDKAAKKALENIQAYSRKKPLNRKKTWTPVKQMLAQWRRVAIAETKVALISAGKYKKDMKVMCWADTVDMRIEEAINKKIKKAFAGEGNKKKRGKQKEAA